MTVWRPGITNEQWRSVRDDLATRSEDQLSAVDLDTLAEALFWLDERERSVRVRGVAYRRRVADGDGAGASLTAWRLFYEHWLVGEDSVSRGWLERCRSHVTDTESAAGGWLAVADTDIALAEGRPDEAVERANQAVAVAAALADPDLRAMGLQALGRAEITNGSSRSGMSHLDHAMVGVIANEVDPHYVGWVYCNVIATCYGVGDLKRANEWSEAALRWCESLRDGAFYPGLCRIYAAELAQLRGDWDEAETSARAAIEQVESYDPRFAGAAHYVLGEAYRLRGRLGEAEEAFRRSHALGREPLPGLALVWGARGRTSDALRSLRSATAAITDCTFDNVRMLAALVDLAAELGEHDVADATATLLGALVDDDMTAVVCAYAEAARGRTELSTGRYPEALQHLAQARAAFVEAGLAYEVARTGLLVGEAAAAEGNIDTARLEFETAIATFTGLGAAADVASGGRLLLELDSRGELGTDRSPLTDREVEVLRIVADGASNRAAAEILHLSRHTVARHLSNIFTKLDVGSRAAATARAYELGLLVEPPRGQP